MKWSAFSSSGCRVSVLDLLSAGVGSVVLALYVRTEDVGFCV